ncbi:similar to Saccharomyces cerevisiae YDR423C CAD1 AP-1-like basic leucine zipper (bZIP) transcriptional activator involved in stress responses, iron metabolism, and pleiotropic drug resistance [Maudiozyma barnettii]|nr:similar to Saccharomyces cerevisiae YDR423C CAD1 AP-1-like basic leucine zipper (bZIP) transcriptional activator involved in stress responses, iron metabolism, and pleiotropic drug resistance [Kazachstania barnettii]
MSTTAAKRPLVIGGDNVSVETGDRIIDHDEQDEGNTTSSAKKSHHSEKNSKNSKTPLDEDTKNKRTAQNRAAQRAFRERKEKKMKELEEKVNHLQDIHKQSEIESEFLRGQLFTLVKELKKFRPETSNDSEVLNYLAQHEVNDKNLTSSLTPTENYNSDSSKEVQLKNNIEQKKNFSFSYPFNSKNSNSNNIPSPDGSSTYSSPNQNSTISKSNDESKFLTNNNNFFSNDFGSINSPQNSIAKNNNNTSTTEASTPSMNWLDNIFYNDNMFNQQVNGMSNNNNSNRKPSSVASLGNPANYDSNMLSNEFNFDEQFDEQVTDFCVKMNQVCGTRENPVPKTTSPSDLSSTNTPQNILTSDSMTNTNITIPSSVGSMSKKLSFGEIGYNNGSSNNNSSPAVQGATTTSNITSGSNTVANIPFINDALAFPTEANDLMNQPRLNNDTPESLDNFKPSSNTNSNFDTSQFFRTPGSTGMNNDIFNQFLQDDDDENNSDNERNPLDDLINEEPSVAPKSTDKLSLKPNPSNVIDEDDDDTNAVVPSKDGDLLKCSEIWDRITSHPKYSDIDIDGLCGELMSKAKCSERGVVVNASDVQLALSKHMA